MNFALGGLSDQVRNSIPNKRLIANEKVLGGLSGHARNSIPNTYKNWQELAAAATFFGSCCFWEPFWGTLCASCVAFFWG